MHTFTEFSKDERGSAALELALVTPLLMLIMALCLDLGTFIQYTMATNSAATAAARYLINHPEKTDDTNALRTYLVDTFPELGFETGDATVEVIITSSETQTYPYRLYDGDSLVELPASNDFDHFAVTVASTTKWPALSFFLNSDTGCFTVTTTRNGDADRTDGTSW